MKKSYKKFSLFVFLILGIYVLSYKGPDRKPAGTPHKRVLIGIDGISREMFDYARKELRYFQSFNHVSTHIATFPSISDYSWNVMLQAREVHGKRARIGSYEATRFDRDRNELVSDPREYFRRLGQRQFYFNGAFEHYLNPYIESVLYLPTEELPKLELKHLKEAVFADSKELVTVMIASNDALAHTRADSIKFIKELDQYLREIDDYFRAKGVDAEIIIVSDHGQASRFAPGAKPLPLIPLTLGPVLKRAGLNLAKSLKKKNDVVIPIMALANYGTAFVLQPAARMALIKELQKEAAFNLAIYKRDAQSPHIVTLDIFDRKGSAQLTVRKKHESFVYIYTIGTSNPLNLPREISGIELSDEEARALSMKTPFPDALYRIAFSAFQEEADFPDLLFTLNDEYFIQGELSSFTTMYQTHGSLSPRSSYGVVASTHSSSLETTPFLRTTEVLQALALEPRSLFRVKEEGLFSDPEKTMAKVSAGNYQGIETGNENFSGQRIFELLNKVVNYSQYVFDIHSVSAVANVVKPMLNNSGTDIRSNPSLDLSKMDTASSVDLNDIAKVVDIMIRTGDLNAVQNDPEFLRIKEKLTKGNTQRKKIKKTVDDHIQENRPLADAAKKLVMKSYSTTFLLEKALEIPEFNMIKDTRNHVFRKKWNKKREELNGSLLNEKDVADVKQLFSEVFTERRVAEEISPMPLPYLYNPSLRPLDNVTIVYVPGIYNSLFDNEIFKIGLDNLVNNLGLRVIAPPVYSSCSSDYNGQIFIDYLKKDQITRQRLGFVRPKYFIMGYSKGGIDTLHGLMKDPEFVRENIHGLITIASPIRGTTILNKSDLPFELVSLLGTEDIPNICRSTEKASTSITPEGASAFLRKFSRDLVGLTRYYSLSFSEDIKNSHIFMKASKNIAQFGEANDGVVTVSASTFPPEFQALNLGVVKGDHLAGIVASKFPQEAFLESVIVTMLELDAFNKSKNLSYNEFAVYNAESTSNEKHKKNISSKVGNTLDRIFHDLARDHKELKRIENLIKKKLKGSPYETSDFSLMRKKGKVHIVFSRPLFNSSKYLAFITTKDYVRVDNVDQIMDVLLSQLQSSGKNLLKSGVSLVDIIPVSKRPSFKIPDNQLGFVPDLRINLRKLGEFIEGKKVNPITPTSHPKGIEIVYDHGSTVDFRKEYELSFESTAPFDADDNDQSGWAPYLDANMNVMAKLTSKNSSIRLTSYSLRFLAADFPYLTIDYQINNDVAGANVLFGGSGKDDSAFQLSLTFRVNGPSTNRQLMSTKEEVRSLTYYFGDEISGRGLKIGEIYENYYSKKNFLVAVLPEAHQKLIGMGKDMLGKPLLSKNNLLEDLKKAFPNIDHKNVEILGITFQHDSNDTKGDSEALFKSVKFEAVE